MLDKVNLTDFMQWLERNGENILSVTKRSNHEIDKDAFYILKILVKYEDGYKDEDEDEDEEQYMYYGIYKDSKIKRLCDVLRSDFDEHELLNREYNNVFDLDDVKVLVDPFSNVSLVIPDWVVINEMVQMLRINDTTFNSYLVHKFTGTS